MVCMMHDASMTWKDSSHIDFFDLSHHDLSRWAPCLRPQAEDLSVLYLLHLSGLFGCHVPRLRRCGNKRSRHQIDLSRCYPQAMTLIRGF